MKLTPRHSRSGSCVVAKERCSVTGHPPGPMSFEVFLEWAAPADARREPRHCWQGCCLPPAHRLAIPVPNPELVSVNDLLSFTQGLLVGNNCLIYQGTASTPAKLWSEAFTF